jgi:lysophospholipase L1-like esterase
MKAFLICFFALLFASCSGARESFAQHERIIFLGDSITASGDEPGGYVALVRDSLTRSSGGRSQVINAGVSGNRVPDLLARVDRDVIAKKPTLTIIYIGINDVWHWALLHHGTTKEQYQSGLEQLISRIRAAGSDVILCTPSVIGEKAPGTNPSDTMLNEFADISRAVARETNVQLLELHAEFASYLQAHNPLDVEKGVLTFDGVHLTADGNRFVADLMLKAITEHREKSISTE